MKKITLWLAVLLLLLAGCSNNQNPHIEEYDWEMISVQSMDADGQAIAFGEHGSSILTSAKLVELTCTAENGQITLIDQTNSKTYMGTYKLTQTDSQSFIYEVDVDGKKGHAVVAMTTYHDGCQEATFIMNLGEYTINFFAQKNKKGTARAVPSFFSYRINMASPKLKNLYFSCTAIL